MASLIWMRDVYMARQLHDEQPVLKHGAPLATADAAVIMVHGRGATAESMLSLAPLIRSDGVAFLAPQAAHNTWYPRPFTAPLESNEPWLSSALKRVGEMIARVAEAGVPLASTYLLGFSQGACLVLEYAARHAQRYGGVIGLSGGLIGPDGSPRDYAGTMDGAPVFLACSDLDPHISRERVVESASVFRRLGADVTLRLYPNMGHTVNDDEIAFVRGLLKQRQ